MPRSRRGAQRPPPESDEPQLTWGAVDEDEEDDDLGSAPPAPIGGGIVGEKPSAPPASTSALGPPPKDSAGASKWAYMMHMMHAYDANQDEKLTPSQRRKEVRTILAGAAKHYVDAMRFDVVQLIKKQSEQLEAKKRGKAQAKLEKAAPAPGAKIIPIRRG